MHISQLAQDARQASFALQSANTASKNQALDRIHDLLAERKEIILKANKMDLQVYTSS